MKPEHWKAELLTHWSASELIFPEMELGDKDFPEIEEQVYCEFVRKYP